MSYGGVAPELAPNPLHNTSKYKAYAAAVDKALKAFENTNEWADLIAALGKLTKVLNANHKFGDIPKPVTVAKRLSQCLHPALPSVHTKALEAYRQVFDILGKEKLGQLLYLFAVGLFPLMDHCGIKVKSDLFTIFEQYLLPLGEGLRPSLSGFLAGVLLGLEEGTEFYGRSLVFLDRVCEAVGTVSFFSCVWQAVLGSPAVRLPALIYINAKLDKNRPMSEQMHIVGNTEHMVAALCAAADDSGSGNPLVQRHLLDFLTTAFPLDSPYLKKEHFVMLLQNTIFVVLKRDMSLNRRLYQWLLNPTGCSAAVSSVPVGDDQLDTSFFLNTVLPMIKEAASNFLALDTIDLPAPSLSPVTYNVPQRDSDVQNLCEVRFCRLLLYLQDRPEIGRPILTATLPILLMQIVERSPQELMKFSENSIGFDEGTPRLRAVGNDRNKLSAEEIFTKRLERIGKSFNLLLHSLDDGFLWDHLSFWFSSIIVEDDNGVECCGRSRSTQLRLFPFVVRTCIQITQLDTSGSTRLLHLPSLLKSLMGDLIQLQSMDSVSMQVMLDTISVCEKLLEEMFIGVSPMTVSSSEEPLSPNGSPAKKITGDPHSDREQKCIEICLVECLSLFSAIANRYCLKRTEEELPLLEAICQLVWRFVDFPIYCLDLKRKIDTRWVDSLLQVVSANEWAKAGGACDFNARSHCLDLLLYIVIRSTQVLEQHEAHEGTKYNLSLPDTSTTTVLLKPLLDSQDLKKLDELNIFELSAKSLWKAVSNPSYAYFSAIASRLLAIIHARKSSEPSSEAETIMVAALTDSDQVACAEAARTFDRVWALTRGMDELHPGLTTKLYGRVVSLLLGVLADESVASDRSELKSVTVSWFVDCAKHNDLPRIVQMLSTMLMNPVTARVSIQYVSLESTITKEDLPSLPDGTHAVTLVTADNKHKMHHVILEDEKQSTADSSAWMCELRTRLLASAQQVANSVEREADREIHRQNDIPIFDEDNDTDSISIDTLSISLEGIDPAIIETVQYLVDMVVDEEESELDIERRFQDARDNGKMESDGDLGQEPVVFRSGESPPQEKLPLSGKNGKDSVSRIKKGHRRQDSLQESIFSCGASELRLLEQCELVNKPPPNQSTEDGEKSPLFHELHTHMLLYGESGRLVDLGRAESAFRILASLLRPRGGPVLPPRMLLNCLVSSGTSAQESSGLTGSLVELMGRHVKAILGQQFWGSTEDDGKMSTNRHLTLLELLLTITLHFLRSYFLNSPIAPVSDDDLMKAWRCKMAALDFLTCLLVELGEMLRAQQSQALVIFVQSILTRSKLQKCLLHLLLTAVHDPRNSEGGSVPITVTIAEFNEGRWASEGKRQRLNGLLGAYHSALLSLTAATIRLEHDIKIGYKEFGDQTASGIHLGRLSVIHQLNTPQHRGTIRGDPQVALVELRMFLLTVLNSIKRRPERHKMWLQFIMHILPWLDRSLSTFCVHVIEQICKNIENSAAIAYPSLGSRICDRSPSDDCPEKNYPANYLLTCLETMTTIIHFCVIESGCGSASSTIQDEAKGNTTQASARSTVATPSSSGPGMMGQAIQAIPGTKGATELFTNLVKVFSFGDSTSASGVQLTKTDLRSASWQQAKKDILANLPHALATICDVWGVIREGKTPKLPLGNTQQLRRLVIDLLSPLAQHHHSQFMQALSLVWLTRSSPATQKRCEPDMPSFNYSTAQLDVADLLLSIRVLPLESVIGSVADTLKEAAGKAGKPQVQVDKASFPTEAPLLELLHGCMCQMNDEQLKPCWSSLFSLFTESNLQSLPPRAVFLQFMMLCDFVRIVGALHVVEDKTLSKGVQDACQRLTDAVNGIVGWQLEATTWLKRTLVVKQDASSISGKTSSAGVSVDASPSVEGVTALVSLTNSEMNSIRGSTLSLLQPRPNSLDAGSISGVSATSQVQPPSLSLQENKRSSGNLRGSVKDPNNNKRDPTHSTQALFLLAENLPDLMDSISKSDDKDRLLPTLHAVWANVIPYLRAKNARNARFFLASSQLLATMSSYNYMRPVWKKTTLELLLDGSFFKMDIHSVRQWLIVTDHLMTHDKTSFKELLKSVSYTSNASFSLMTSKEQEYEARTQALKRLAFIVLGSELDQYHTQLPDIQERLAENLRVCQAPPIRAAVLLCYRVLLIRLRPSSLVSMWPGMVTELVHVLLQVEQQLADDPSSDGSKDEVGGAKDDQWMHLFLAAAKLLETLCTLPAGYLSEFQMCNWAFASSSSGSGGTFIPFADRINNRLKAKYGKLTSAELNLLPASLNNMKMLTSFEELRPFFYALTMHGHPIGKNEKDQSLFWKDVNALSGRLSYSNAVSRLEYALYVDFAEHWQL